MIPRPLGNIAREFALSRTELSGIVKAFQLEMSKGLLGHRSSLKMIPSFTDRPAGNEKGRFIALDLGGTHFRVLGLSLDGKGSLYDVRSMKFELQKEDISTTGKKLFGRLASSVIKFIKSNKISSSHEIRIGFTFSFPAEQTSINRGKLVLWTKGFSSSGVEGKDVVVLLERSLKEEGAENVAVAALVNDTVGTLVAGSYGDISCDVGVIIGTGTNACYVEDVCKIKKLKGRVNKTGNMIVNIEWGNFNKLRTTRYDKELDLASENPREQMLEKMVSGKYLGEICALIIKERIRSGELLGGVLPESLVESPELKSETISEILADRSEGLDGVRSVLLKAGIRKQSFKDRSDIRKICQMVTVRAARICGAAIVAVVRRMDPALKKGHTIAVDGSVYEKLPGFTRNVNDAITELTGERSGRIRLLLTKDGSGCGAAIVAASVLRKTTAAGI